MSTLNHKYPLKWFKSLLTQSPHTIQYASLTNRSLISLRIVIDNQFATEQVDILTTKKSGAANISIPPIRSILLYR